MFYDAVLSQIILLSRIFHCDIEYTKLRHKFSFSSLNKTNSSDNVKLEKYEGKH